MVKNTKIASPWVIYYRKLKELFAGDHEVRLVFDEPNYIIRIYVDSTDKAEALDRIVRDEVIFGNITLRVQIIPPSPDYDDILGVFQRAFQNNPALVWTQQLPTPDGSALKYAAFRKDVVQYPSDNLGDANGLTSTLFQDIAKEVLIDVPGMFYCTDSFPGVRPPRARYTIRDVYDRGRDEED